jgi:hypothetical protein
VVVGVGTWWHMVLHLLHLVLLVLVLVLVLLLRVAGGRHAVEG